MSAELEECEWEGCCHYFTRRIADAVLKSGDRRPERRVEMCEVGEEKTPKGYKRKLNECQGYGLWKRVENGFRGRVCKGRTHVPDQAENLQYIYQHCIC